MVTISKKRVAVIPVLLTLSLFLSSFIAPPGGDSFEIYLNKKLVMQQYVAMMKGPNQLTISQANYNDQVDLYYNHCGRTGTSRVVTLKDAQNKTIQTWKFADAMGSNTAMSFQAKELLEITKAGSNFQLIYSSKELPEGRVLVKVVKETGIKRV